MSQNFVVLEGRLTVDPELKFTTNGKTVANFGLAVERPLRQGQEKPDIDFFNITVWGKMAEYASDLPKGSPVALQGRLQQDRWEQDGQKRTAVKVIAMTLATPLWAQAKKESAKPEPDDDDSVPF